MSRHFVDLSAMPNYNPAVQNGTDSVSRGLVLVEVATNGRAYPRCSVHGAMLKVSEAGIWRCGELHCGVGCFEVRDA